MLLLGVVACGGDDQTPDDLTIAASTDTPMTFASPTATALPTAVSVTRTDVVTFVPPSSASRSVTGGCFGQSIPVSRIGVWRCMASSEIYDPCFGAQQAKTVICVRNPQKPEEAVQMNLLDAACENAVLGNVMCEVKELPPSQITRPWAFLTAHGSLCTLLQGTAGRRNGELVIYSCLDGITVLGLPEKGAVWTVRIIVGLSATPETVPLRTVWQ